MVWTNCVKSNAIYGIDSKKRQCKVIKKISSDKAPITLLEYIGGYIWASSAKEIFVLTTNFDILKIFPNPHQNRVRCFCGYKEEVWSGGEDSTISIWSIPRLSMIEQFPAHEGKVKHIARFSDTMWSCSWDNTVKIWNAITRELIYTLPSYHQDATSEITFLYNDRRERWNVYIASHDGSITIWDLISSPTCLTN